jgi:hypothetical protein
MQMLTIFSFVRREIGAEFQLAPKTFVSRREDAMPATKLALPR